MIFTLSELVEYNYDTNLEPYKVPISYGVQLQLENFTSLLTLTRMVMNKFIWAEPFQFHGNEYTHYENQMGRSTCYIP